MILGHVEFSKPCSVVSSRRTNHLDSTIRKLFQDEVPVHITKSMFDRARVSCVLCVLLAVILEFFPCKGLLSWLLAQLKMVILLQMTIILIKCEASTDKFHLLLAEQSSLVAPMQGGRSLVSAIPPSGFQAR